MQYPEPAMPPNFFGGDLRIVVDQFCLLEKPGMSQWRGNWFATHRVPDPRGLVQAGSHEPAAIAIEAGLLHVILMLEHQWQLPPVGNIPNDGCEILACRDDALAIWAERALKHTVA